jgi:hypothetical protein
LQVLTRVAIYEVALTPEHGVVEAPHFVLDLEEMAARLRMHEILETILKVIGFLRHQAALFQEAVRSGKVRHVNGEVMAVIVRQLVSGFTEDQLLRVADAHAGHSAIDVLRQGVGRFEDLHVKLADAGSRSRRHVKFNVGNA